MSVTTAPAIDGVPLRLTASSPPTDGVFFTVNAAFARLAAAARASLKVTVSAVPFTAALDTVGGRNPDTWWLALAVTAAWVSVASLPDASSMSPPFSSSAFAATAMPSGSASPSATV